MTARLLTAAALVVLALGCSSSKKTTPTSGGRTIAYSGSTSPVALTATSDKQALASTGIAAAQSLGGFSQMAFLFAAGAPHRGPTVRDALVTAADAFHRPEAAAAAGAVQQQPCPAGGTETVTVSQASTSVTTAGDYVEVAFAACAGRDGEVVDGSFRLTVDSATAGTDFVMYAASITSDRSFGMTIAFNDWTFVDPANNSWSGIDGDISVAYAAVRSTGTVTYSITGTGFVEAFGVGNAVSGAFQLLPLAGRSTYSDVATEVYTGMGTYGASLSSSTWDLDARMCLKDATIDGCLNVETNPRFQVDEPNQYPGSGAMKISDAGTDFVRVTAVNGATGACTLDWSLDGATGSQSCNWSSL
jgi:hypothetical protein